MHRCEGKCANMNAAQSFTSIIFLNLVFIIGSQKLKIKIYESQIPEFVLNLFNNNICCGLFKIT